MVMMDVGFFFFKQKTAYEMRISDWSSDVCSSDLFNWLPRKFKLAFSATTVDRAATRPHDIGIHIVRNERVELGYMMYVGGGLGCMPMLGHKIRDFLPELDLLSSLAAFLPFYTLPAHRPKTHRPRKNTSTEARV